jgi:uncharacterized DUF497 family protein
LEIDFDPWTDSVNRTKHGVSLATAALLDREAALAWVDDRFDYGETRIVALVPMNDVHYFVAFVEKRTVRRIISLRRANRREVMRYEAS